MCFHVYALSYVHNYIQVRAIKTILTVPDSFFWLKQLTSSIEGSKSGSKSERDIERDRNIERDNKIGREI